MIRVIIIVKFETVNTSSQTLLKCHSVLLVYVTSLSKFTETAEPYRVFIIIIIVIFIIS